MNIKIVREIKDTFDLLGHLDSMIGDQKGEFQKRTVSNLKKIKKEVVEHIIAMEIE